MRFFRTAAMAFGLTAMLLAGTVATAQAATPRPSAVPATAEAAPLAAWECPAANLCVWENTGGTGRRCNWSDADPDWWSGSIVCSWADDTKVESFRNNGRSTSYTGVRLYHGASYSNLYFCARQLTGELWNIPSGGVYLRSHQWVTGSC
jgi:hypothetical protein